MLKYLRLPLILISLLPFSAFAQNNEVGIMLGVSQYLGDLSKKIYTPEANHAIFGVFYKTEIHKNLSFKVQYLHTKLEGNDSFKSNRGLQSRNLSFYTNINELDFTIELNLFNAVKTKKTWINPYIFTGINFFRYNPKTILQGKIYELRDLPTELKKPKYSLTKISIPLGFGLKKITKKNWIVGAYFQYNLMFTDYLDDVSGKWANYNEVAQQYGNDIALLGDRSREKNPSAGQKSNDGNNKSYRGNATNKDSYYYVGFTIAKKIGHKNQEADGLFKGKFKNRRYCPSF